MGEAARQSSEERWVYSFGGGTADGDASMKNLLGGKGANLAEMATLGLPVPPGFTITTAVCTAYYELERSYPETLSGQVDAALAQLEEPASRVGSLWRTRIHARHDGYGPEPWPV